MMASPPPGATTLCSAARTPAAQRTVAATANPQKLSALTIGPSHLRRSRRPRGWTSVRIAESRCSLEQVAERGFQAGCAFAPGRAFQHLRPFRAGVLPSIALAVPVPEEHIAIRQIVLDQESRRAFVKVDHGARVAGRRAAQIEHVVAPDLRWRLIGENVDAAAISHTPHVVVDAVIEDLVVAHGILERCPAPTHADAGVRHVDDLVVLDGEAARITGRDRGRAPVLGAAE